MLTSVNALGSNPAKHRTFAFDSVPQGIGQTGLEPAPPETSSPKENEKARQCQNVFKHMHNGIEKKEKLEKAKMENRGQQFHKEAKEASSGAHHAALRKAVNHIKDGNN
ncbi:hypothetical protein UY3_13069 [Chelonia mydas]|uniref:Uncharacterized protein n=1 Tax=Chelonia mydas TaxID=8469 RepID=M7BCG6_CHEMY|nr:hypothetical protein UY3_13069 [Chelonia mydas]